MSEKILSYMHGAMRKKDEIVDMYYIEQFRSEVYTL